MITRFPRQINKVREDCERPGMWSLANIPAKPALQELSKNCWFGSFPVVVSAWIQLNTRVDEFLRQGRVASEHDF